MTPKTRQALTTAVAFLLLTHGAAHARYKNPLRPNDAPPQAAIGVTPPSEIVVHDQPTLLPPLIPPPTIRRLPAVEQAPGMVRLPAVEQAPGMVRLPGVEQAPGMVRLPGVESPPPIRRLPEVVEPPSTVRRLPQSESPPVRRLPEVVEPSLITGPPADASPDGFPGLPPDPAEADLSPLPPLTYELWLHGGSYLYAPEGDRLHWPEECESHYKMLRLPESWRAPQPVTLFDDFLGTGPIPYGPNAHWPFGGYSWDPRLVLYGGYQVFGIALEENGNRHDLIGHQLLVDLDFRLTSTERVHAQWRPVGEGNTGGSFYQFNNPSGYVDNSSGIPQRYWIEWEVASLLSGLFKNPFVARDYNVVVGKFPFVLQNRLLMNDEILGVVISKNTIYLGNLSNLNVQTFFGLDDVEAYVDGSGKVIGMNAFADWRRVFIEATYAHVFHGSLSGRDADYLALSATKLYGARAIGGRAMFKLGDEAGRGSGALYVLETNKTRILNGGWFGIEKGVYYATAFHSTEGWNSISGGNFNRLRLAFAVNPVILLSASRDPGQNTGATFGVQYFRHHEDESLIPEVAVDTPQGSTVWGVGLRYQRKTGARSFFEVQGVGNFSGDPQFRRQGVSVSQTVIF